MSKPQKMQINWLASAGSALGAVTSAVLLSTLGAAGTLVGAALGSLIITVGGSIYTQSLQKTTARVSRGLRTPSRTRTAASAANEERRTEEETSVDPDGEEKSLGRTLRGLPWKRILGLTLGLFVAAMAVIVVFELSTGRPVSSFTGGSSGTDTGTTFSELRSDSGGAEDPDAEEPGAEATSTEATSTEDPGQEPMKEEPEPTKEPRVDPAPAEEPPVEAPPADEPAESDE